MDIVCVQRAYKSKLPIDAVNILDKSANNALPGNIVFPSAAIQIEE